MNKLKRTYIDQMIANQLSRIDFAVAKSISCMFSETCQKIKRHRNQRIYRVFCSCFFEFQKIATTTFWKTNFVYMFLTRDTPARLSYVAGHESAFYGTYM